MIEPSPIVTPGNIETNSPIQTFFSIITGLEYSGLDLGGVNGES
ncbi:hypothetical protein SDC9_145049 [bioreactor metagenome]|uniref:Uncharacterized protein n=1 Tax=bioreactor metagenome TaxID=1076179 RepID=A0A645E8Y7_9ZZZZ